MLEKINEMISDFVEVEEPITEETNLRTDLGMSSLDLINLAVEIEDSYGIELPDEDISGINTVSDLIRYISVKKD